MKTILNILLVLITCALKAQSPADSAVTSYNIVLNASSGDIYGTITVPKDKDSIPVVLIIPGSGNTDRNGNSMMGGIRNNCYKMLAEELARNGIASLRFDKRGVAKSSLANKNINPVLEDYVSDVIAWTNYLRQEKLFSRVVYLGHGEGSLIGMIAAQKKVKVSSFISVEGAGKRADQLLREQFKALKKEEIQESNRILDSLLAGKTVDSVSASLQGAFQAGIQPYLISWMKYDPSKEIQKLSIPVLIIQGSTDLQIPAENGRLLSKANPKAKYVLVDKMNYTMKEAGPDLKENYMALKNPSLPLQKDLVKIIVDFVDY
jgi:pimeloyl-ACP methyl ester carboxylesterase